MSSMNCFAGVDLGGTKVNVTLLGEDGTFRISEMLESPSLVGQGPAATLKQMQMALTQAANLSGIPMSSVKAVGLDTPGPASADGVISAQGSTNFGNGEWARFPIREAFQKIIGLPTVYANDGNAAAFHCHRVKFGRNVKFSSMTAAVGTGLGGGIVVNGQLVVGNTGFAAETGHVVLPSLGLLDPGQPMPKCNCGREGDAEAWASLTGIRNNLLPYYLRKYPNHPLWQVDDAGGARSKQVRAFGEDGDPMARQIFEKQAIALAVLFDIAMQFLDLDAFFVGGGVMQTKVEFREWFLGLLRKHLPLRDEQLGVSVEIAPDGDMAGARGAARLALESWRTS
ncbi:MAG: ROK family protein [Acidobacteria bacterium]|nr:ROK family protein [Acidobacteriota bacterium]